MSYAFWADAVVAIHTAYVAFVVLGQGAILIGWALGWRWVRNPWFRLAHLIAITLVGVEAVLGIECPLTVWEWQLRVRAGQEASAETFVGRCLNNVLMMGYFEPWVYTVLHVGFALLVITTAVVVPPRWWWSSPGRWSGPASGRSAREGTPAG
jgi:hypothetical protein